MKYRSPRQCIFIGIILTIGYIITPILVSGSASIHSFTIVSKASTELDLGFCTYIGGTNYDYFGPIAVDANGDIYLAGDTASTDFPTTDGAYDRTHNGGSIGFSQDAFVMKLSGDGQEIIYSTFIGGSDDETIYSIAVDDEGNAYVTGVTASTDFPTTNDAYDRTYNGGENDCFVAKLSSDGSELLFSTYVGGLEGEFPKGIAVGENGECHVVGNTYSSNFPVDTVNEQESCHTLGGDQDGFVFKVNADGSSLEYSMFLGGNGTVDTAYSIALDSLERTVVVGVTSSFDFPIVNAINSQLNGVGDSFISRLMPNGTFDFSTYLGGSMPDRAYGVALNPDNDIYIIGSTDGGDFPIVGADNLLLNGNIGIFLSVLNASGSEIGRAHV